MADGRREEVERMNVKENRKGGLHRLSAVILINTSNEIHLSINYFLLSASLMLLLVSISLPLSISFFSHLSFPLVAAETDSGVVWFLESQSRDVIPESTETNRHRYGPRYPAVCVCHGENITGSKVCGNDS